jgi:hypothetical protein
MTSINLLIDFGLFILIWMVQLLIYPSFKYFQNKDLILWHRIYTRNISLIVMPLMLVQLFIYLYLLFYSITGLLTISMFLIVLVWLLTFGVFVPIHQKIASSSYNKQDLIRLKNLNWIRTIIWTLIMMINFF